MEKYRSTENGAKYWFWSAWQPAGTLLGQLVNHAGYGANNYLSKQIIARPKCLCLHLLSLWKIFQYFSICHKPYLTTTQAWFNLSCSWVLYEYDFAHFWVTSFFLGHVHFFWLFSFFSHIKIHECGTARPSSTTECGIAQPSSCIAGDKAWMSNTGLIFIF